MNIEIALIGILLVSLSVVIVCLLEDVSNTPPRDDGGENERSG